MPDKTAYVVQFPPHIKWKKTEETLQIRESCYPYTRNSKESHLNAENWYTNQTNEEAESLYFLGPRKLDDFSGNMGLC